MKKTRKLLSILLALCMILTILPMGVMAAEPTGPKSASDCTLGTSGADYKLNIVNDAEAPMLFEVQVNGKTEQITVSAGETLRIGVNEGDQFKVTKVGNTNYKVLAESATFQSGEYENVITKTFSHKVGAGFKTGEKHVYVEKDGSIYEGDTEKINGITAVKGSKIECKAAIKSNTSSNAVIGITVNGAETTTTVSGNFASSNTNSSTATSNGTKLTTAMNDFFKTVVSEIPEYDAARYDIIDGKITGKTVSSGGCNSTTTTEYTVDSSPAVYIPLEDQIIDIVDEVDPGDITLTYTTGMKAKAGGVSVNVLNGERLDDLNSKINVDLVTGMMSMLTAGQGSEGTGMSMDTFTNLFANEQLMGLLAIEASDNMPKGYTVTLTEVNKGDGLYEGLVYEIPMKETMFIHIDMEEMMQEALGGTLFGLAKGQIPAEMLAIEMDLPVSIGQAFEMDGIRAGQYQMTITSPGEGWYADGANTFTVNITDGNTAADFGGSHVYGSIRTSTLINPITQAMGMDLGCLGGLAGLMLGNNALKMVETSGVVFNHKLNHIEFTNAKLDVDDNGKVTTTGLPGATFMLVDRDRFNALIDSMLGLGGAVINSVVGGIRFDELLGLQQEINEGDSEEIETEPGMIDRILVSVIALGDRLDGIQVPAMLESVADDNGLVTFDPEDNVTLQKLINLIPVLTNAVEGLGNLAGQIGSLVPGSGDSEEPVGDGEEPGEGTEPAEPSGSTGSGSSGSVLPDLGGMDMGTIMELIGAIGDPDQIGALMGLLDSFSSMGGGTGTDTDTPSEPAEPAEPSDPSGDGEDTPADGTEAPNTMEILMNMLQEFGGGDLGFAMLNLIGLSDGRFPTSNYLLLQAAVPEGRVRNPMMYVLENTWNAEEKAYHTYASVDLAGVMSNEQFAFFAEQLEKSYGALEEVFGNLATAADDGLDLARAFLGEGDSYNSLAVLDKFDEIAQMILQQIEAARAAGEEPAEPAEEEPAEPGEDVPDVPAEPGDTEEPVVPLDPEDPAASVSSSLKEGLASILDQVLNTYIPKATVLTYISNLIYRNSGGLFDSQQEVSDLVVSLAMDDNLTFSEFNTKIQKMLDDADFVLNGEVTKNWYYYDVNPNIFTNVNVAYHYILNEMLPPELANVIERALQGQIDQGEALVDELINQLAGNGEEEAPVPEEPDAPDLPGTSDSSWISGLINTATGIGTFIRDLVRFFKRL